MTKGGEQSVAAGHVRHSSHDAPPSSLSRRPSSNNNMAPESSFEITRRVARYAYDRLTFAGPAYAIGLGTAAVWTIGAIEGSLYLKQEQRSAWLVRARFVSRYALYNIVPSLIWGTHVPSDIVASSPYLRQATMKKPTDQQWLYSSVSSSNSMPPKRVLWIKILCSLRGAVAGSVVLANVIALTSLWQRARQDYADRIQRGREPPLMNVSSLWNHTAPQTSLDDSGCTIRLAGVCSDVTELSLHRRGPHRIWPVFEDPQNVRQLVSRYGAGGEQNQKKQQRWELLPRVPVYWQVDDGEYSKASSWEGMNVPDRWLFSILENGQRKRRLLYLEADATSGDENALSLQQHAYYYKKGKEKKLHDQEKNEWRWGDFYRWTFEDENNISFSGDDSMTTTRRNLDLDLKEVAQGFRRLADLAKKKDNEPPEVMRVLLVDPTVVIESGGGRRTTVRDHVEELGLADVLVDSRASVLHAILEWLRGIENDGDALISSRGARLKPVILETPSRASFQSIRSELRQHGYEVMDRAQALPKKTTTPDNSHKSMPPMLVYERSSADTVHTIRQYLERGIVNDPSRVCALLTCHEGLGEVESLNESLMVGAEEERTDGAKQGRAAVGYICSSDIHDRALEWVRRQCIEGVPAEKIQEDLDAGRAWHR